MSNKINILLITLLLIFIQITYSINKPILSAGESEIISDLDFEEEIEEAVPTRTQLIMTAIMDAYPDRIEQVEYRTTTGGEEDWALLLRGIWYFFAGGRLLPENQLENAANYRAMQFYNYPDELPPWVERTPEERTRMSAWTNTSRTTVQISRSDFFLNSLWESNTQLDTERKLVWVNFLGRRIRVHQLIQDKIVLVDAQIMASVSTDPAVQPWINSLDTPIGYNWRNIAITESRSYHSYGLAIDLLPRNLGGRQTYWLWTSQHRSDWFNVSYSERYHPPDSVIKAFEAHGFIWGGKWAQFDTMHFEYRPELLIFNGFTLQ